MKVLLTGAAGLIGMALRPMLARRGHNVVACDITAFGRTDPELRLMPLDERPRLDFLDVDLAATRCRYGVDWGHHLQVSAEGRRFPGVGRLAQLPSCYS